MWPECFLRSKSRKEGRIWRAHNKRRGGFSLHFPAQRQRAQRRPTANAPHLRPCGQEAVPMARDRGAPYAQRLGVHGTRSFSPLSTVALSMHRRQCVGDEVLKLQFADRFHNFWENWQVGNESIVQIDCQVIRKVIRTGEELRLL